MTGGPIDTIREALLAHLDPEFECKAALAALTQVEHQLAAETHYKRQMQVAANDALARAVAAETALAEANTDAVQLGARLVAAEQRANALADALRDVTEQQPKTVEWLRANGIVFDGPLGTDPDNWQHVAFSIYNDLCEADSIARAALDRQEHR